MNDSKGSNMYPKGTAAANGLVNCLVCYQLNIKQNSHCQGCGARIEVRIPNSVQITLSLLITSMLLYIPANIFPIMTTVVLGEETQSTIIGGVILFLDSESYLIASVIFIASIIIPLAKMTALAWLCYSVMFRHGIQQQELTILYRVTEFIGKWSMIDVFVVAILVALIQLGDLMSIKVGLAATAFALVVILTMISAQRFDTRLLWDKLG
ncbi:paraquat-inducible protein A [Glaciecola sp. KUL10]|uniref:paraquat-inducible protein A n=1 Tax=Glaciecola sp. (strain KUL10) TaxID=2161813 RepID=UPI000D9C27C1|nr:paraquat-inducible protein A [Glaciecola sp. KUL10]GBL03776.1 integral membrane protein, PqiA family [Glaciecola sp. KUL10]